MNHIVSSNQVTFDTLKLMLDPTTKLTLSDESKAAIKACRDYLDKKMESSDAAFYGINTGFGSLYNKSISKQDLGQLQVNLVMSHACGTGEEVSSEIVKLMLFLKILKKITLKLIL